MARLSLDTNILVYALDPSAGERHVRARDLLRSSAQGDTVLTQQVIGEFLNVGRRSAILDDGRIRRTTERLCRVFTVIPTQREALFEAFDLAQAHRLQFWDAVIVTVCQRNSIDALFSEDMHDGQRIGGTRILNPFDRANDELIERLLG